MEVFIEIAGGAEAESAVWAKSLLPSHERQLVAVFSELAPERYALGLETVYEAYLVHYGRPRLLYAHGLVRVAEAGGVPAVSVLADLIARCAALRADGAEGDGNAWVDAARSLGGSPSEDEVASALALHFGRVAA